MSPGNKKTNQPAQKKRSLWLKILLFVLIVVFVLIALGPTIVSTSPLRNFAVGQINQHINGRVSIDSWSIGWFTGVEIQGLSLEDENSEPVAAIENVSLDPSYLSLMGQNPQLGKINIRSLSLDVRFDKEGQTSLEDVAVPSGEPGARRAIQPSFDLKLTESVVRIHKPDAAVLSIENINASVQMLSSGQPISFELSCDLTDARGQGKIQAQGSIPRRVDGSFISELVQASAEVSVKGLDLQLLRPFLQRADLDLETAGLLDIGGHVQLNGLENIEVDCQANSTDIKLSGELFKGDELDLRDFSLRGKAYRRDMLLGLEELRLDSDLIALQTGGTMQLGASDKLPQLGSADLEGKLTANLPKIFNQLPSMLHFQPGLKITNGQLAANYTVATSEGGIELLGSAALENLQGATATRVIQLDVPVELSFDLLRSKEGELGIRSVSVNSGFGRVLASGQANDLTVRAEIDLAGLNTQLAKFIDLGETSFAGQLFCDAKLITEAERLDFEMDLSGTDLFIHGLTLRDLREPQAKVNLQGSLVRDENNKITAVTIRQGQFFAEESQLQFSGNGTVQPLSVSGQMNLKTDLAKVDTYLSQFMDLGKFDLAGQLLCQADIATSDRKLNFKADLTVDNLVVSGLASPEIREPRVQVILDGSLTRTEDNKIASLAFKQAQLLADKTRLQFAGDCNVQPLAVSGQVNLNTDLAKVDTYLSQFMDLGKFDLAGQLLCQADIATLDRQLNFQAEMTASELVVSGLASPEIREPRVQVILDGSATRSENNKITALSFKQAQLLSDKAQLQFSGQIDPEALAITGQAQIKADLARVQELAEAFESFPEDIKQLQGQLDSAVTLTAPRLKAIGCEGRSNIQGLRIVRKDGQAVHEPKVSLEHDLIYDLDSRTLDGELPQLQLAGLNARCQELTLTPRPTGEYDISTRVSFQGDLGLLNPWLVAFAKLDPKVELGGQLAGKGSYGRQGSQENFALDTDILNLKLRPPDKAVFVEPKISLQVEGSADRARRTLELSRLDVTSGFLQVNAQVTTGLLSGASTAKITLQAQSDLQRLSRVMEPWFSDWPELRGSGRANMTLVGTPGSADWIASLSGPAVLHIDPQELAGVSLGSTDIDMQVKRGVLIIPPSTILANEGKLNFQARVSLTEAKPFLVISQPINLVEDVQINTKMSDALLKFVNPVFADNNQVSGSISFVCNQLLIDDLKTWKKTAKMNGLFSGKELLFQPRKGIMSDLGSILGADMSSKLGEMRPVSIELADGVFSYKDMHLVFSSLMDLSFSGEVGLDESINMRVGIPILPSMLTNNPELSEILVGQRIYMPIKGTLSKPELDVGAFPGLLLEQIADVLGKQIPEKIGDLLKDIFK